MAPVFLARFRRGRKQARVCILKASVADGREMEGAELGEGVGGGSTIYYRLKPFEHSLTGRARELIVAQS